jgi:hypothetical protein
MHAVALHVFSASSVLAKRKPSANHAARILKHSDDCTYRANPVASHSAANYRIGLRARRPARIHVIAMIRHIIVFGSGAWFCAAAFNTEPRTASGRPAGPLL